jgi:peptidoglycan lytic transglycosylase
MKRVIVITLTLLVLAAGLYLFNQYWIHRYDRLIVREAVSHNLDPDLVWSIVYEETYFRPWKNGRDGEVGLMQVTPTVGESWATETGKQDLGRRMSQDAHTLLRDPERNVQVGCWYLEKAYQDYRDTPGREARMLAAYNAGPGRAANWNRTSAGERPLTEDEFIARIDIPSTKAYVTSILARYRKIKATNAGIAQRTDSGRRDESALQNSRTD